MTAYIGHTCLTFPSLEKCRNWFLFGMVLEEMGSSFPASYFLYFICTAWWNRFFQTKIKWILCTLVRVVTLIENSCWMKEFCCCIRSCFLHLLIPFYLFRLDYWKRSELNGHKRFTLINRRAKKKRFWSNYLEDINISLPLICPFYHSNKANN